MNFSTSWRSAAAVFLLVVCGAVPAQTTIAVTTRAQRTGVKRFGINLSGQTFYDSGQLAANLLLRNPGFEGGTWQSILRCKHFGPTYCADENPYTVWPDGFMNGAHVQVISGPAMGANSVVTESSAATPPLGFVLHFQKLDRTPRDNDFLLVRTDKPGDPLAGWWTNFVCGAAAIAETHDLPPNSPSHQALRVNASAPCQHAEISSYFDSFETHSFVRLHGTYELTFKARGTGGENRVHITIQRLDAKHGIASFLDKVVPLSAGWQSYTLPVRATDRADALGAVRVSFTFEGSSALLDDVNFAEQGQSAGFRPEVVSALRELRPGILRFMDNGTNFGSSLEDLVAPPFARRRTGYSTQEKLREDIGLGVPEVLALAETVGAEPWITLPPGFSPFEMQGLLEYLAGPSTTPGGAKRAAAGRAQPWTEAFAQIHLELGNEQWNSMSFSGAALHDPVAYGQRAAAVFTAARSSRYFAAGKFDLVAGSWFAVPWWTGEEAKALHGAADSIAVAPYLFSEFNDASSTEAIFGSMFAQPEEWSTNGGAAVQQRDLLKQLAPGTRLSVYEVNLGTATGSAAISQQAIDRTVPSVGGGIAVTEHMLLMLRELGVTDQCLFALPEFQNGFTSPGGPKRTTPLWGAVVDMGGSTNARRPTFLATQALNAAILPTMVSTEIRGSDPIWNQAASPNDKIAPAKVHLLQSFAFADGAKHTLIVFNLSRDRALPVNFDGVHPTHGRLKTTLLTSDRIEDNNENGIHVRLQNTEETSFNPQASRMLPPFSMTTFRWRE